MTGSSAYNERVSEEAVWKAIERVADELKHDAHKRYHGVCVARSAHAIG